MLISPNSGQEDDKWEDIKEKFKGDIFSFRTNLFSFEENPRRTPSSRNLLLDQLDRQFVFIDRLGRDLLDDAPMPHQQDAVARLEQLGNVVGDDQ